VSGFIDADAPATAPKRAAWKLAPGGRASSVSSIVVSAPVCAGARVVVGTHDGVLHVLDAATGAAVWTRPVANGVAPVPVVDGADIAVSTDDGVALCHANDGAERWRSATGRGDVLLSATTVLVATRDPVHALERASGRTLWTTSLPHPVGPLARADDVVLVPSMNTTNAHRFTGELVALDADTGAIRWRADAGGAGRAATPSAAGVCFRVGGLDTAVRALDVATGAARWSYAASATSTPALDDARVYVVSHTHDTAHVHAVERATGVPVWRTAVPAYAVVDEVVVARATVLAVLGTTLAALDAASGALRWALTVADEIRGRPAIGGGRLLVATKRALLAYKA
jgi:serine/threonine-protein kinase